jgi:hypothetical protein
VREPRGEEAALQALECAEGMVSACAESAKLYRRWSGPLGEPMTYNVDAWLSCSVGASSSYEKPPERWADPKPSTPKQRGHRARWVSGPFAPPLLR